METHRIRFKDGPISGSDMQNIMISLVVKNAREGCIYTIEQLSEFLPNGKDVFLTQNKAEWCKKLAVQYTQEDLILAATKWINK